MGETLWIDDYTLLCESCGYNLEDLDQSLPCPECGKPILESLPHFTAGSPWQKRHTLVNLIKTWLLSLARPRYLFRRLNINQDSGILLLLIGSFVAYFMAVLVLLLACIPLSIQGYIIGGIFLFLIPKTIAAVICWIVTVIYAVLGLIRLRYFARRNGYRLTASSRWTIVGHASLGLTVFPIAIAVIIAGILTLTAFGIDPHSSIGLKLNMMNASIFVSSVPLSLIIFELLLHIGSRNLRNRNIFPESDLDNEPPQDHGQLM